MIVMQDDLVHPRLVHGGSRIGLQSSVQQIIIMPMGGHENPSGFSFYSIYEFRKCKLFLHGAASMRIILNFLSPYDSFMV